MRLFIIVISLELLLLSCSTVPPSEPDNFNSEINVKVLKWFNGHKAAVTINYDAGWNIHPTYEKTVNEVMQRNLTMDWELITSNYMSPERYSLIENFKTNLMSHGIHFFGHGHRHINHDSLNFNEAYEDFKLCFDLMTEWGLKPSVYAYPGSLGYLARTQLANMLAGFISARGGRTTIDEFFICPDNKTEPDNWYYLPSAIIASENSAYINNDAEIQYILNLTLDKTAWIILMYHSIGFVGGYHYYPMDEFVKDLDFIAANDFWCGNMDLVVKYIKERNNFNFKETFISSNSEMSSYKVEFFDNLENEMYNQPLSIEFEMNGESFRSIKLVSPEGSEVQNEVTNGFVTFNIIPDEKEYIVHLVK